MKKHGPDPREPAPGDTGDLARLVQRGDQAGFQELYDRVAPALYAWLHLRTTGDSATSQDLQDLLQEVWLQALRRFESYDPARSFRPWILGITKNVLLQSYRKTSYALPRAQGQSPSERQLEVVNCPDSVTSIGTRLAKDDAVQRFLAYVDELAPEDRMLVLYCGLEEYTSAQAAARLQISADAANKRWQSLRARMRENGVLRALAVEEGA